MIIHGSYAMFLVILNQTFSTSCRTMIVFLLLHVMTHNVFHSLRLRGININAMVIHLKKCPCICWCLPCEPIFWLNSYWTSSCSCHAFNLKNLLVVLTKLSINNYFIVIYLKSKPTIATPNPIFTKVDYHSQLHSINSLHIFYDYVHKNIMVFNHYRLAFKNTMKHQQTYCKVTMVENLKLISYETLCVLVYCIQLGHKYWLDKGWR
jgi:hypothetical protein